MRGPSSVRSDGMGRPGTHGTIGHGPRPTHDTQRHVVRQYHNSAVSSGWRASAGCSRGVLLGPRVHTVRSFYGPSWNTWGYGSSVYYGPPTSVYVPGSTLYMERVYERPVEESIQYVPIEAAPEPLPPGPMSETSPPGSFMEQGDAAFRQGGYDEARRLYIRALLSDDHDPTAQLAYAWTHLALADYRVASIALRRALVVDPGLLDAPPDPRGRYGDMADFDRHLAALREQVAQSPDDVGAAFLLAYVEYAVGNPAAALEQVDRILSREDTNTLVYLLGDAALRAQDPAGRQPQPTP
ncbi:MAG: tetratricopeptide repeat protein [Planctomycetota bacterium]